MPRVSDLLVEDDLVVDVADLVHVVDVSDTSLASTGRNKKLTFAEFLLAVNRLNTAVPVLGGRASGQILNGSSDGVGGLTLRASAALLATDNVSVVAAGNESIRVRGADGHVVLGTDPTYVTAANVAVSVRRGNQPAGITVPTGCLLQVMGDFAEKTTAAVGCGLLVQIAIGTGQGGTAIEQNAAEVEIFNDDANYAGTTGVANVCALNPRVTQRVTWSTVRPVLFAMNPNVIIGDTRAVDTTTRPGVAALADPTVTKQPAINCIEVGLHDRSATPGLPDLDAYGVRCTSNGVNDPYTAFLVAPSIVTPAVFRNGLVMSTGNKTYDPPAWQTGFAYLVGDYVTTSPGVRWIAKTNHTSNTAPATPAHYNPLGNATDWKFAHLSCAPADNFIWCGPLSGNLPTGVAAFQVESPLGSISTGGHVLLTDNAGEGFIEFSESAPAPAAPGINKVRLFAKDSGAGKTQLCAIMPGGNVVVLATQT